MTTLFDFTQFPVLTTERLRLRALKLDDAPVMVALFSDPRMMKYLNDPPTETVEQAVILIDWLNSMFTDRSAIPWGITLHGDDTLIGTCEVYSWDRANRHVDIGYNLLPAYWGQGIVTEAVHAMLRWSFEHLDVHRVQADCTDGNIGSERVLLKCGFRIEGIWRESTWEHERFVDIKQFGLLRREYDARG